MTYTQFKNKFQRYPLIATKDVIGLQKNGQIILNQFNRWRQRGLIIKLKRGIYLLNKNDRKIEPSRYFIANRLYGPSYVSLESAFNFYGLIPERVSDVTSITTKKTARFRNDLGMFVYQHIKPDAFRGFKTVREGSGYSFFIAEAEKTIVDFLYLNLEKIQKNTRDVFRTSYRFQNTEGLKKRKLIEYASLFRSDKLMRVVRQLCEFLREGE